MEITLDSGIEIVLYELVQKLTYEGLIEGVPTKGKNAGHVKRLLDEHRSGDSAPYLIEPVETLIDLGEDYPFGEPASIPGISCVARFESNYSGKVSVFYRSTAKVIWFQSEFALPIAGGILDKIRSIDWPNISREYEV